MDGITSEVPDMRERLKKLQLAIWFGEHLKRIAMEEDLTKRNLLTFAFIQKLHEKGIIILPKEVQTPIA